LLDENKVPHETLIESVEKHVGSGTLNVNDFVTDAVNKALQKEGYGNVESKLLFEIKSQEQ